MIFVKQFHRVVLLLCFLVGSNLVSAQPKITFASAFNIKAVNGAPYSSGLIAQNKTLTLNSGINLIALEYEEVFDSEDDDSFDIVKSDIFLLRVYLKPNASYFQRFIKPIDANAARKYRLNPLFSIIDKKHPLEKTAFSLQPMANDNMAYILAKTKLKNNKKLILSSKKNNGSNQNTLLKSSDATFTTSIKGETQTLQQLHYWWSKATKEEKSHFLEAIE